MAGRGLKTQSVFGKTGEWTTSVVGHFKERLLAWYENPFDWDAIREEQERYGMKVVIDIWLKTVAGDSFQSSKVLA